MPDTHYLTRHNEVEFCPATLQPILLCVSGSGASGSGAGGAAASGLFAASAPRVTSLVTPFASCVAPFVASFPPRATPFHPIGLGFNIRRR